MKKAIIGLTGGIASGKSAVSDMLSELGAYIIDADVISKSITADDSPVLIEIEKAFPGTVKNGRLDRLALKKSAFATIESTKLLNSITHPAIFSKIDEEILGAKDGIVVLVVPLMYETGADKKCDAMITVSCPMSKRIERLTKRDNIDNALAEKIISRQTTDEERERRADFVIVNDSGLLELRKKVEEVYEQINAKFI